jgi:hypothetical protein
VTAVMVEKKAAYVEAQEEKKSDSICLVRVQLWILIIFILRICYRFISSVLPNQLFFPFICIHDDRCYLGCALRNFIQSEFKTHLHSF